MFDLVNQKSELIAFKGHVRDQNALRSVRPEPVSSDPMPKNLIEVNKPCYVASVALFKKIILVHKYLK